MDNFLFSTCHLESSVVSSPLASAGEGWRGPFSNSSPNPLTLDWSGEEELLEIRRSRLVKPPTAVPQPSLARRCSRGLPQTSVTVGFPRRNQEAVIQQRCEEIACRRRDGWEGGEAGGPRRPGASFARVNCAAYLKRRVKQLPPESSFYWLITR